MDNGKNRRMKTIGCRPSSNCLSRLSGQEGSIPILTEFRGSDDRMEFDENIPIMSRRRRKRGLSLDFRTLFKFQLFNSSKNEGSVQ